MQLNIHLMKLNYFYERLKSDGGLVVEVFSTGLKPEVLGSNPVYLNYIARTTMLVWILHKAESRFRSVKYF